MKTNNEADRRQAWDDALGGDRVLYDRDELLDAKEAAWQEAQKDAFPVEKALFKVFAILSEGVYGDKNQPGYVTKAIRVAECALNDEPEDPSQDKEGP
jgi:hypothetical protein